MRKFHKGGELTAAELKQDYGAWLSPSDKRERIEIKDGSRRLWLYIQPSGAKSFVYVTRLAGKLVKEQVGRYPTTSLADARRRAAEIDILIDRGEFQPSAWAQSPEQSPEPEPQGITAPEAWIAYMNSADVTDENGTGWQNAKWSFWHRCIKPVIGTKLLADVTFEDCSEIILDLYENTREEGGTGRVANRLHSVLSAWLNWCAYSTVGRAKTKLVHNPMGRMKKPCREKGTQRALNREELIYLFRALPFVNSEERAGKLIRFDIYFEWLLRSLVRRANAVGIQWGYIRGENAVFPASTTKAGIDHLLYLTPQMRALCGVRPNDAPATARIFHDIKIESLKAPTRRLREKMAELAREDGVEIEHWTPHCFRHTGKTWMASARIPGEVSEHVLQHKIVGSKMEQTYNMHEYEEEKREALTLWNRHLDGIKKEAALANLKAEPLKKPLDIALVGGTKPCLQRSFCQLVLLS